MMMIAKEVPKKDKNQASFKKLADYITRKDKSEKIIPKITNCGEQNYSTAIKCIESLQNLGRGKQDKTYHLVLSFHRDDKLDNEKLAYIENECAKILGFAEHQRISAFHQDTNNPHLHIAINRINPRTKKTVSPYFSFRRLAKFCSKMENELGLVIDNHLSNKHKSPPLVSEYRSVKDIPTIKNLRTIQDIKSFNQLETIDDRRRARTNTIASNATTISQGNSSQHLQGLQTIASNGEFAEQSNFGNSKAQNHDLLQEHQRNDLGRRSQGGYENLRLVRAETEEKYTSAKEGLDKLLLEYIAKRNALLGKVADIQEHRLFGVRNGIFNYQGTREIAKNQFAALLSKDGFIYVKPISKAERNFLKNIPRGTDINISISGKISNKVNRRVRK